MRLPRRTIVLHTLISVFVWTGFALGETAEPFSVVLLPDTQYYAETYPAIYLAQTTWIRDQAAKRNIKMLIHLGDIVDVFDDENQWRAADQAHRVLDGAVPYSVLPGNHDMNLNPRDTTLYNKYFGPKRFEACPSYGGHQGKTNDNNFCRFEGGGMKLLVINLEFAPSDAALDWAAGVIDEHPDHRVMVATHSYVDAKDYTPEGRPIWEKFIRRQPRIFMVHCGHICAVSLRTSHNDTGGLVYEMLTDYQDLPNGGDGWLRVLRFVPDENRIHVEDISPTASPEAVKQCPISAYSLEYDMGGAAR